mgnify:CR=1 FL=1
MEEKSLTKIIKIMKKETKTIDKGLIHPEEIKTPAKKIQRKISLQKDIVEREGEIKIEDGRQLLK